MNKLLVLLIIVGILITGYFIYKIIVRRMVEEKVREMLGEYQQPISEPPSFPK